MICDRCRFRETQSCSEPERVSSDHSIPGASHIQRLVRTDRRHREGRASFLCEHHSLSPERDQERHKIEPLTQPFAVPFLKWFSEELLDFFLIRRGRSGSGELFETKSRIEYQRYRALLGNIFDKSHQLWIGVTVIVI